MAFVARLARTAVARAAVAQNVAALRPAASAW